MLDQNSPKQDKKSPIIQKVIIYGVQNPQGLSIMQIRNNEIKVGIKKCYTFNSKSNQIIDTTQIEQDKYEMWVYPDGIKISDSQYQIINDPQPQFSFTEPNIIHLQKIVGSLQSTAQLKQPLDNIYTFVLTDYDLNRTYCTCIVWHEKRFVVNDEDEWMSVGELEHTVTLKAESSKVPNLNSKILPKCTLNQLIQDPLVLDPTSSLVYIPKGLIICSPYPCLTFQRQLISFLYMNGIKKHGEATLHKKEMDELKNLIAKFGYPQAEKFYDQEEFLNQRQQRQKLQQKQLPIKPYQLHSKRTYERLERQRKQHQLNLNNLRTLQKKKLQQFYLSLMFLPELIQSPDSRETPTQVISIQDTITADSQFQFQPYYFSSTCFKMPNFNILSVIEKIGINNLITLWKNCVLERQILVFSSDQFVTIELFETLLYLLQPLKWQNIYVPFLPYHLCHHIQALGGYLIGMSKIHMNYMIQNFSLQSKVFVDLDQMIIIEEGGKAETEIPSAVRQWMVKELQALGFKYREMKSQEKQTLWSFPFSKLVSSTKHLPSSPSPSTSPQQTMQTTFSVHKVFFTSLFYLLNNYSPFIFQDNKTVRFDREPYFRIFPSEQEQKFASEVVKTMMFIRLCEFHKNAENSLKWNQSDVCSLFVYCHYIMKQQTGGREKECWEIGKFAGGGDEREDIRTSGNKEVQCAQKLNQYVNYVMNKNLSELTSPRVDFKTYKIEHYLSKYLNYLNYTTPGIILMSETPSSKPQHQWLDWLLEILKRENIQKQEKRKMEKLNKLHDFWTEGKKVVNLNCLFQNIGKQLCAGLRKGLAVDGWQQAKIVEKMKFNREHAKSSQSVN